YESLSVLTTPLATSARSSDCALTLREIYANRITPAPDPPAGIRRHRRSADRRRQSRRTAATLTRNERNGAGGLSVERWNWLV
ncbi:MAG TPA: hypothetical protein VK499_00875, partial [Propionibacteriaceae bacterium]|nr:hypothetical protein [Propionibacteriaceae bacterium]